MSDVEDILYSPIEKKPDPAESKRSIYEDLSDGKPPPGQRYTVIIDGNPVEIVLT
jgi:hypothetical protein